MYGLQSSAQSSTNANTVWPENWSLAREARSSGYVWQWRRLARSNRLFSAAARSALAYIRPSTSPSRMANH